MKFTNYTAGPKGLNAVSGLVMVDAGKSVDVEISEAEAASAKATGWFSRPKVEDDDAEEGLNGNTVAELKAIAEKEEIDLGDATKKADIIAAIELAREATAA
jgi:hypothetical protein